MDQQVQAPEEGMTLRRALLILRRRWKLALLVWAATVAGTAIFTFTATKLYRSQATLEIRPEAPLVSSAGEDPWIMAGLWENYYATQESILTSPALAEATLKELPPAIRAEFSKSSDPGGALAGMVDIEKSRNSFIMKIGIVDRDPEFATQVVNVLVDVYRKDLDRWLREVKQSQADKLTSETLPDIRKRVEDAERRLDALRAKTGFTNSEDRYKSLVEKWNKFDIKRADLKIRCIELRAKSESLNSYQHDGSGGVYNPEFHKTEVLKSLANERSRLMEDLAKESRTLKEDHPKIRALRLELKRVDDEIAAAIAGTLDAITRDLQAAENEEAAISAEVEALEEEISRVEKNLREYREVQAEVTRLKELYANYVREEADATATSGVGLASVRVIDYARVPGAPFKPKVTTNLGLGVMVGLLLAIGAMLAQDQLDNRILSPDEVEAFVGLEVLAVVPKLSEASGIANKPILLSHDSSLGEFEAFRSLRSEVVTRLEKIPGGKVLAVLSAMDREGKTTVIANLARALAMEGRKVLVFDADLRRPSFVPNFAPGSGPGLGAVLRGEVDFVQVARKSTIHGVDAVGVQAGKSGASELASSPRFADALRNARERYDVVLVDSAPVMQASEAALMARHADAAILVVREGRTARGAVRAAKKRLEGMEVVILGAVLSCDVSRSASYGYYSK